MRTKRFIIIGLASASVILLIVIVISKTTGGSHILNPCPQFLTNIQNGEADKAYSLLSKNAMQLQTKSDWEKTAANLQKAWSTVTPIPQSTNTKLSSAKGATLPSEATEAYEINNAGITYVATCYLTQAGSGYQISAFNSYSSSDPQQ